MADQAKIRLIEILKKFSSFSYQISKPNIKQLEQLQAKNLFAFLLSLKPSLDSEFAERALAKTERRAEPQDIVASALRFQIALELIKDDAKTIRARSRPNFIELLKDIVLSLSNKEQSYIAIMLIAVIDGIYHYDESEEFVDLLKYLAENHQLNQVFEAELATYAQIISDKIQPPAKIDFSRPLKNENETCEAIADQEFRAQYRERLEKLLAQMENIQNILKRQS